MTWGRKTGGRDFKPGQSGNPNGRPAIPEEIRALKQMSAAEFIVLLHEAKDLTKEQAEAVLADPDVPLFDKALIRTVYNASEKGNLFALNVVLDRLFGTVAKSIQLSGDNEKPLFIDRPSNDQLKELLKIARGEAEKK